ncbi:hypothetical protein [Pseudomonas turukhanskensis]|uniref:SWIM-type domain-containing protein n=1 Tax=Pseudomonas turukhanskensis TaxID=1806536 RepID=A0A9W6K7F7_9PSED|nr:hypothetical protein [Pseudomonas turukhanskensis]GLK89631.1 hypothetical protein GCM10017655_26930 [Pseudomonas turukhanskensis]
MSLQLWLSAITDETLEAWANKGLLRRGYKLLDGQTPAQWLLQDEHAQAQMDGFEQQVGGVGFERLRCSCPALGSCHHLLAFVLGLRARLASQLAQAAGSAAPSALALAEPWLIADAQRRKELLGQPALTKAQRWQAQGITAECNLDAQRLVARIDVSGEFTLSIPRAVGLAGSVCSCGEHRCAHRALVVLQLTRQATPEVVAEQAEALNDSQHQALQTLDQWLLELTTLGMAGASAMLVARGDALATTLQQADLPLPGRLLARLVRALDDERLSLVGSTVRQARLQLAQLLAFRRALARTPLPQPLPELAGVHRKRYQPVSQLELLCVGAECWTTASGFAGYSLYFLNPSSGGFYTFSQSRSQALNPGWQATQAFAEDLFCGRPLRHLLGKRCQLLKGWVSSEGRLSGREGSQLQVGEAVTMEELGAYAQSPASRMQVFAEHRRRWLYRNDPQPLALIAAHVVTAPQFERFGQRWQGEAMDDTGQPLRIVLPAHPLTAKAALCLSQPRHGVTLLLGRWTVEGDCPTLYPVVVIDNNGQQLLFCEAR